MSNEIEVYIVINKRFVCPQPRSMYGIWIDATLKPDKIKEKIDKKIDEVFKKYGVPFLGYEIADQKGFGYHELDPFESVESIHDKACFINKYPKYGCGFLTMFNNFKDAQNKVEQLSNKIKRKLQCSN